MMTNRPEFNLVDTAALHLGATPFSIYNTSSPEQIEYLFPNAENRVVITEAQFVEMPRPPAAGRRAHRRDRRRARGQIDAGGARGGRRPPTSTSRPPGGRSSPTTSLTLIYTSGTTGPPKGVEITHANMMAAVPRGGRPVAAGRVGGRRSLLPAVGPHRRPLARHYYAAIVLGSTITSVADPREVVAALPEVRPDGLGRGAADLGEDQGRAGGPGRDRPGRAAGGGRGGDPRQARPRPGRWLLSGAAPIAAEVLDYFGALGLPICELWGMSEPRAAPPSTRRSDIRSAPSARRCRASSCKLAEDGELLVRGPIVMQGYRKRAGEDGRGDRRRRLAAHGRHRRDRRRRLRQDRRPQEGADHQRGRQEHVAGQHRAARQGVAAPLIGQAVAIGDRRPYNVALLVLDPDACARTPPSTASTTSPAALADDEACRRRSREAVDEANAQPQPRRADQALHDRCRSTGCRAATS